ncbi:hypothetical protein [Leptolyngbya ohadii]|uniref:hypothetical protein n=1 Tax=Leptolyngbya ohadii TaxID=1962290 RepID=UPI000B59EB87|nr:hypothetical protein [Leptolyngbya ohadii]
MVQTQGREVTDREGTTWNCVEAYADIAEKTDKDDLAKVKGENAYWVVCTPSGGAQSVRVKLPEDWETACSDEEILEAIEASS